MEINDLVETVESYSNYDALRQVYREQTGPVFMVACDMLTLGFIYSILLFLLLCLLLVFAKIIIECFDCSLFKIKIELKINLFLYVNM